MVSSEQARSERRMSGTCIWVSEDEFAEGGIERVAIHTLSCGEDQIGRRAVPKIPCLCK